MSPLVAKDAVGLAGCGLPAPSRRGGDSDRPPRPWGRAGGTFPAWTRAKKTRSPAEGAEGLRRAGGKHQRRAVREPERGRARGAEENRQVWGVLGTRKESRRRRRVVSQP